MNRAIARAGVTTKRMTRLEAKRVIWEIWAMRGKGIQRATLKWAREAQKGMSSSANPPDESPDDSRAG